MGLLRAFDVAGAIEELNLHFYVVLFNLSLQISGWERLAPPTLVGAALQVCSRVAGVQVGNR